MRRPHTLNDVPRGDGFEEVLLEKEGRSSTISIALPSSILGNAQSAELRIYLAGQIARAASIYSINEIVIFEEKPDVQRESKSPHLGSTHESDHTAFLKLILEYLETPQYLRRHLFPVSQDLRLVGLLNPLGIPSHVSRHDFSRWREGISVGRVSKGRRGDPPPTRFIDVGLQRLVEVNENLPVGNRVTVDMSASGLRYDQCPGKYLYGTLVDRREPRRSAGLYWGYRVRTVPCLSAVFSGNCVSDGYDLIIGTSERGTPVTGDGNNRFSLPETAHTLIVFGGVHGLERSVRGDAKLQAMGFSAHSEGEGKEGRDIGDLFDYYVNTCPEQGSRTIRSEEAILITLAALMPHLRRG